MQSLCILTTTATPESERLAFSLRLPTAEQPFTARVVALASKAEIPPTTATVGFPTQYLTLQLDPPEQFSRLDLRNIGSLTLRDLIRLRLIQSLGKRLNKTSNVLNERPRFTMSDDSGFIKVKLVLPQHSALWCNAAQLWTVLGYKESQLETRTGVSRVGNVDQQIKYYGLANSTATTMVMESPGPLMPGSVVNVLWTDVPNVVQFYFEMMSQEVVTLMEVPPHDLPTYVQHFQTMLQRGLNELNIRSRLVTATTTDHGEMELHYTPLSDRDMMAPTLRLTYTALPGSPLSFPPPADADDDDEVDGGELVIDFAQAPAKPLRSLPWTPDALFTTTPLITTQGPLVIGLQDAAQPLQTGFMSTLGELPLVAYIHADAALVTAVPFILPANQTQFSIKFYRLDGTTYTFPGHETLFLALTLQP